MKQQFLFSDGYRECPHCQRSLPLDYPEELCPACLDQLLFNEVRDYIRENTVNEHDVAEHFQLPISKIRQWIRDGRIEYREEEGMMTGQFCRRCGKTIFAGYFCPMCTRLLNQGTIHAVNRSGELDDPQMRFIDEKDGTALGRYQLGKNKK